MDDACANNRNTQRRFQRVIKQLIAQDAGGSTGDPDRHMRDFNAMLDTAARDPIVDDAQLQILHAGIKYLSRTEPDVPSGSLDEMLQAALTEAITGAPDAMHAALLALVRHKLRGGQVALPDTPATSPVSRALRRKFEMGAAIHRRLDEQPEKYSDAEYVKGMELLFGSMNEILRSGIRNELELKTVIEGIEYEMKKEGINHSIQDAIDYALYVAFEHTSVWPYSWLFGLARFQLRGFNAPWDYPEPKFVAWIGEGS